MSDNIVFDTQQFDIRMAVISDEVLASGMTALHDCADDLIRISSNIAPIDKDVLRKSHTKKVQKTASGATIEVAYSVSAKGKGRFNYALAMHEWVYTPSHAGSYEGYFIGRKYLERPLKQETPKYMQWIGNAVKEGMA